MKGLIDNVKAFIKNEDGQGLIEYVLIIAVIALVIIAAMKLLQTGISNAYNNSAEKLSNPTP